MAVAVDATGSKQFSSTASTTTTFTNLLTVGSGLTNNAAVFGCLASTSAAGTSGATFTATFGGVSCFQILKYDFGNGVGSFALFGVIAPSSGAHNLVVTTTNSCQIAAQGTSFTGVDQTGGATSFPHSGHKDQNPSALASDTLVITTANGNYTYAWCALGNATSDSLTPGNLFTNQADFINQGINYAAAQSASSSGTTTYTASQGSADFIIIVGTDILAAAGSSLVASWYSPFEGPPNRLKPRPASFQETQTALSTSAPLENHFPALFDVVSLLKKQTGFVDLEVPPSGAVRPLPAFEPLPPKLILRPPGFQENHTNIQTIAAPSYQTALFDPAKPLKLQAGFVDSKIAPAPVAVAAITQDQTFHPAKPLKVQPGFVHVDINVATQAPLTNHFPTFFDSVALQKRPAGFDDRPWPIVPTPPLRTDSFFPVLRLKQNIEFQQQYQNPTITAVTPPVFTLSPSFAPSVKLRPPDSSFFYTPQFIFVAPSQLKITDTTHLQLPINAILMGQQDYEEGESIIEASDPNYRTKVKVSFGGGGKLSSNDPTFTTTTSKKGYD